MTYFIAWIIVSAISVIGFGFYWLLELDDDAPIGRRLAATALLTCCALSVGPLLIVGVLLMEGIDAIDRLDRSAHRREAE